MLSKKMEKALNDQVVAELYSGYLYLSMASYFSSINLPGFAHWLRVHRLEETSHGMKFYDYIESRGGRVKLGAIEAPKQKWDSPLSAFKAVMAHEKKVTGMMYRQVLESLKLDRDNIHGIVSTGYGRNSVSFANKAITEITCHAAGAFFINPNVRSVIDIGGQDSKVILLNDKGLVSDFAMNDKCAAGTGRFLEVMARALEIGHPDKTLRQ